MIIKMIKIIKDDDKDRQIPKVLAAVLSSKFQASQVFRIGIRNSRTPTWHTIIVCNRFFFLQRSWFLGHAGVFHGLVRLVIPNPF